MSSSATRTHTVKDISYALTGSVGLAVAAVVTARAGTGVAPAGVAVWTLVVGIAMLLVLGVLLLCIALPFHSVNTAIGACMTWMLALAALLWLG
jgi:hypothetical protein